MLTIMKLNTVPSMILSAGFEMLYIKAASHTFLMGD